MSDQPPPGYDPPPGHGSGPSYGAPPPGPPGAWGAPVYKPGVVALRPLSLGDCFDGSFKTIRANPKAMVGLAALVTAAFLVVPALVGLLFALFGTLRAGGGSVEVQPNDDFGDAFSAALSDSLGNLGYLVSTLLGSLFGFFASVVITGMLIKVVAEAVLGNKTSIGGAWTAVRGRLLRLLGLTLLESLVSVVIIGVAVGLAILLALANPLAGVLVGILVLAPVTLAALAFVYTRWFLLASPALVLERTGVVASLQRASSLSRRQFWRLFGITLLAGLVAGVAGAVISVPLGLLKDLGPDLWPGSGGALVALLVSFASSILVAALVRPFTAGVTCLQYVDQRIRKEGLDVQLIAASQSQSAAR